MITRVLICILLMFSEIVVAQDKKVLEIDKLLGDKKEFRQLMNMDNDSIKLQAIKFLLGMEGDLTLNITWYGYTDSMRQEEYNASISSKHPEFMYGTNQFISLYLITAIYHSNLQFCEQIKVVYLDDDGNKNQTTNLKGRYCLKRKPKIRPGQFMNMCYKEADKKIIEQMFVDYKEWFNELNKFGFEGTVSPVSNSYKWYNSLAE